MIKRMQFDEHVYRTTLGGRELVVEIGKVAQLANGSCLVRYGDTVVLVTVTASAKPREGVDFFPMSVDFEERLYAVGRVPGSFMRREGRPSEKAILAGRLIDRPIRPLFPKDMRNDVALVCTVMSVDYDNSPEIAGMIGASIAISISDIPWKGPISGCVVGYVDGEYVINPTSAQREKSKMHVTVASVGDKVARIEAGADDVETDEDVYRLSCAPEAFDGVLRFLSEASIPTQHAEIEYIARDKLTITDVNVARKALKLTDALDEHEDIQSVSTNFIIADDVLAQLEED